MKIKDIDVGNRIRAQRKKRKLSLNQLASMTGIAASNLSSIELNKSSPTLGTLAKIAAAFEIRVSSLVEEIFYDKAVLCAPEEHHTSPGNVRNVIQRILTRRLNMNSMEITSVTMETDSYIESEEGFERFIYCNEGNLMAKVGDESYEIKKNTGLYLMPEVKAVITNISRNCSTVLLIAHNNCK